MKIDNIPHLEEIVGSLEKGHMISLTLNYSSSLGKFRVGRYIGMTKNRVWIHNNFLGTPWFNINYPMGYRKTKIQDIELFDD